MTVAGMGGGAVFAVVRLLQYSAYPLYPRPRWFSACSIFWSVLYWLSA
jgi:hypothetical protein